MSHPHFQNEADYCLGCDGYHKGPCLGWVVPVSWGIFGLVCVLIGFLAWAGAF